MLPIHNITSTHERDAGLWLCIEPLFAFGDDIVQTLKFSLLNNTELDYQFSYEQCFLQRSDFTLKNTIPATQTFYLHEILFESLNDSPSLHFSFNLTIPHKHKAAIFYTVVKIRTKQFFKKIETLKQNNSSNIPFLLFRTYPNQHEVQELTDWELPVAKKYGKVYALNQAKQHLETPRSVIDLHIEKLVTEWRHMSNFEIMTLQLKEFEKWYELAIAHRQPDFTVIHGVGTGKLKDEIHALLHTKKEVRSFVNQYHPRFGYGATEIFLFY